REDEDDAGKCKQTACKRTGCTCLHHLHLTIIVPHRHHALSASAISSQSSHRVLVRDHSAISRPRGHGAHISRAESGSRTPRCCQAGNQARSLVKLCALPVRGLLALTPPGFPASQQDSFVCALSPVVALH